MRLKEFKVGETIPEGAVFIEKKFEQGRYLGDEIVDTFGIFPFNGVRYRNVYEKVPVYVYQIND